MRIRAALAVLSFIDRRLRGWCGWRHAGRDVVAGGRRRVGHDEAQQGRPCRFTAGTGVFRL